MNMIYASKIIYDKLHDMDRSWYLLISDSFYIVRDTSIYQIVRKSMIADLPNESTYLLIYRELEKSI